MQVLRKFIFLFYALFKNKAMLLIPFDVDFKVAHCPSFISKKPYAFMYHAKNAPFTKKGFK